MIDLPVPGLGPTLLVGVPGVGPVDFLLLQTTHTTSTTARAATPPTISIHVGGLSGGGTVSVPVDVVLDVVPVVAPDVSMSTP